MGIRENRNVLVRGTSEKEREKKNREKEEKRREEGINK